MKDVYRYHVSADLPAQSYQLDSWWYKKYLDFDGGLVRWEPRADIFPDGIESIYNVTGKPMTLHNRWFSFKNDYMDEFAFATQGVAALPVGSVDEIAALYAHLFRFSAAWGLRVYEQDWLRAQYLDLDITRSNVTVAWNWQMGLNRAALAAGLLVQFCMPLPSDYLMSTQLQAVSQIRVSNDYASDIDTQWRIGRTSMFAHALGLRPFKDVFRTTTYQLPNVYALPEHNPALQTVVATLSAGPVAFGDKIGSTNATLIMRTCMMNGTILAPSRPATAVEATYLPSGVPGAPVPSGEVWSTEAEVGSLRFGLVLAAGLDAAFAVTPRSLRLDPAQAVGEAVALGKEAVGGESGEAVRAVRAEAGAATAGEAGAGTSWLTYQWRGDLAAGANVLLATLSETVPLTLAACPIANGSQVVPWHLHAIVPVLDAGWVLLGEAGKYVPFSPQRLLAVVPTRDSLTVAVRGMLGG